MFAERLLQVGLHPVGIGHAAGWAHRLTRFRECFCAMRGHDLLLHFERRRLSLRCVKCGWDSPGWSIGRSQPRYGGPMRLTGGVRDESSRRVVQPGGSPMR